jgi:chromate transporter
MSEQKKISLSKLSWTFLKLGFISFGGPAVHIAMMEEEFVQKQKLITNQEFLDFVGVSQFIPGPSSTELAIFIGNYLGRWPGLLVSGLSFILPSVLIVFILASLYVKFGTVPAVTSILFGIKPAVFAIILQALFNLRKAAVKNSTLLLLMIIAVVL